MWMLSNCDCVQACNGNANGAILISHGASVGFEK